MQRTDSTTRRVPSPAAVWAPWLVAPLFALLPIGGCGLADGLRPDLTRQATPPATARPGAESPVVSIVPVVSTDVAAVAQGGAAD